MAVGALVDAPVATLLAAVDAVRETPAPLGQGATRLSALAHASAELQGIYLRELAAVRPAEHGARSAADLLTDAAGLPAWQARSDAALARRLSVLPGLLEALAGGGIELAAARLLVRAWTALPSRLRDNDTARALLTLAGLVDLADLRAKVDELVAALAPDVTDDDLADAREGAELTLTDVGAETRWSATTDALTGEWVRQVLAARAEADRGLDDGRTSGRRLLDALLDCLRLAAASGPEPLAIDTEALVVVTTADDLARLSEPGAAAVRPEQALDDLFAGVRPDDSLSPPSGAEGVRGSDGGPDSGPGSGPGSGPDCSRSDSADADGARPRLTPSAGPSGGSKVGEPSWCTRSRGGVPMGPASLAAFCCTAALTRLVTDSRGWPLDSSPLARQLSRRERRALEHRAGYRCQRLGCGRPAHACVPHHVVPVHLGGPSTQDNTALLCRSCHHLLHDRSRPLELTDGARIGPRGWLRRRPDHPPEQLW